ncbi:hypothetical protein ILUMI_08990 [Ignelater luminosus]|uniref:Uncharacterized protein n=1 Tax=Ignelater luminosus TaxID=2038154 RepID=A0A8K0D568_IGNLU|nr:hypothetical protein ILUMI_08990 [Ignelater luminosus]
MVEVNNALDMNYLRLIPDHKGDPTTLNDCLEACDLIIDTYWDEENRIGPPNSANIGTDYATGGDQNTVDTNIRLYERQAVLKVFLTALHGPLETLVRFCNPDTISQALSYIVDEETITYMKKWLN